MRIICLVLILLAALYGTLRLGGVLYAPQQIPQPCYDETACGMLAADLLSEALHAGPAADMGLAVQTIGRRIGARMLADSRHASLRVFYSAVGERLGVEYRENLYRGLGIGFADALCRDWDRLMPPDSVSCDVYARGLEIEWQRCMNLMPEMPAERFALIWEGFLAALEERDLNESIGAFITRKLSMR